VITVSDAAGQVLTTIERELVSGSSTDATIDLTWKAPIVEDGKLCGFVLLCAIRSLSGGADDFTPEFGAHPSLCFPTLSPVWLEPGETAHLELPIRWDRALRDAEGWNHPRAIEVFVAVSQGRRSGRLSWDVVQRSIAAMLDRSDRSPVVERKAASPSLAPTSPAGAPPVPDVASNGVKPPTTTPPPSQPPPSKSAVPKKIRDIDSELAINFEGYRPAFQLVNGKGASQAVQPVFGDELIAAPSNGAIKVDDLDSSIVGSGLNYARNGNAGKPASQSGLRRVPLAAWAAAVAVVAVLGFALLRPHAPATQSTSGAATASAPATVAVKVASVKAPSRAARPSYVIARVAPKPKPSAPSPATIAQTPAATTPPAVQAKPLPAQVATAAHRTPARQIAPRPAPINRSALPEIASVDAAYATRGHAVRLEWYSTSQASAAVQLTDARGTLIAQSAVNGGRSRLLIGLPRGFHGGVYIQVSVTGYHSERVVQTSSLPPF
jgi:hypothetical protein